MSFEPVSGPRRLGRYEVLGLLATGGMAEVHLGRLMGPSGFERVVVLKRILPHLARESDFVDMFLDEARIVAKIDHPNVVHVIELGRDGDELFLAMELVEGESVGSLMRRHWAARRTIGIDLAAYIVSQAAAGLHAAHVLTDPSGRHLEIVHRDVSPQNLMVSYAGRIKVLDFGIAKAVGRATKTMTGELKGKVEYMSPEQCRAAPLDRRSDVFALGVILYELSVTKRLFRRGNEVASLRAVCDDPIPPPESEVPGYPPALARIVMRALERDPSRRYESAEALRLELVAYLKTSPDVGMFEDVLAARMRELFSDRLARKDEMLRALSQGRDVREVPRAEVDQDVEAPVVAAALITPAGGSVSGGSARSRPWRSAALVALPALVGAAGAIAFVQRSSSAGPAATSSAHSEGDSSTPIAPSTSSSIEGEPRIAPAASTVSIEIVTTPPGARITVGEMDGGTTPKKIDLPRGTEPVTVVLTLDGFQRLEQKVTPDVDQRLALTLSPASRAASPPTRGPAPSSPAPSATSRYRKFN